MRVCDLLRAEPGAEVCVQGWLRTARHSKGLSFLDVSDGSCFTGIQVVADDSLTHYRDEIEKLLTGSAVIVSGKLVESPGAGQKYEIKASHVEVVSRTDETYPLQKKRHSFEFLRELAHLRPRTNTIGAVWRVRSTAAKAIHDFFHERGFFYLHTPIITAMDCEGAGALFRVSTLDPNSSPKGTHGHVDFSQDFFGGEAFLTVSGQLEAEIGALALSKVYTFGPTFRAENSNTSRHLAEFWMVEPEMAFCDLRGDQDLAEEFLKYVIRRVLKERADDMSFFAERINPTVLTTLTQIVENQFDRITYTEAITILKKSGKKFAFDVSWGKDLQSEHERFLAEEHFKKPLIVSDYPKNIKAFYMYVNDDGETVRALDVLVPNVGEIIGGSQREDRESVLRSRLKEMGLPEQNYWWYLELRRFGGVPHAGFGLGFERLIQFMTGMQNIRDVIPFPRVPGYAKF